jgi:hypothetical protein
MRQYILTVFFLLLFVNCYGHANDNDRSRSTYCELIEGSNIFSDKKCEPKDVLLRQLIYSPPVIRCLSPGRVINTLTRMCYPENSQRIFYNVKESGDLINYSILLENKISVNDGKYLAALNLTQSKSNEGQIRSNGNNQKVYEFDFENRALGKVLWYHDPNDPTNKDTVANRSISQKDLLVPMPTSAAKGVRWIVAVSSVFQNSFAEQITGHYYQIIEVSE